MFHTFEISPTKPIKNLREKIIEKVEETISVSLAPFTANPKIFFEQVKVGETSTRKLSIFNPSSHDIEVNISNIPVKERCLQLSWCSAIVPTKEAVILELTWCPKFEGAWCDTLILNDGKRLKKSISITYKSIAAKQNSSKTKSKSINKPKYLVKKIKSPPSTKCYQNQNPKITKFTSPKSKVQMNVIPPYLKLPAIVIESPKSSSKYTNSNKENLIKRKMLPNINEQMFVPSSLITFNNINTKETERRDTYIVRFNNILEDSLENIENFPDTDIKTSSKRNVLSDITSQVHTPLIETQGRMVTNSWQLENSYTPLLTYESKKNELKDKKQNDLTKFQDKLQTITPTIDFSPRNYSTEEKSIGINRTYELNPKVIDFSNLSGLEKDCISNSANISSETYVKGNLSSETYVKSNLSSEALGKDQAINSITSPIPHFSENISLNFTPNTGKKISEFHSNLSSLSGESARNVIEANLWSGEQYRPQLEQIREESFGKLNLSEGEVSYRKLKRKSDVNCYYSPLKKERFDLTNQSNDLKHTPKTWSKKSMKCRPPFKFPSKSLNLKEYLQKTSKTQTKSPLNKSNCEFIHDPDKFLEGISNPYLLSTSKVDPFVNATLFCDPKWIDNQELQFKKWLNALLTPPEELNSDAEMHPVDVAKLWQECKRKDVEQPPSKEIISNKYHVKSKLELLRVSAVSLFRSDDIARVLAKVSMMVENNKLYIRADKNVHLDLGLQNKIMALFLNYNPLWLRIGLETMYGVKISLNSNSDIMGLSNFIMNRFFKDEYLLKKYKTQYSKEYGFEIKKLILKKFLMLVFFLDQAKCRKLIVHDPCLFFKNAPIKESRELLLRFSSETLAGIGDVTKYLRCSGYVLTHKQTYIHEFDFSVDCLGTDLRDGVRLTKVMEIILLKNNLLSGLRVPAISRLQKIHNVKIVFDSLAEAGFQILYDITPKDIVDGHQEKTLSFLWQIIYKFQAPIFIKNVTIIQDWWRSLKIVVKRKILLRERKQRENAAKIIQHWYKRQLFIRVLSKFTTSLKFYIEFKKKEKAAVIIQSYYKMHLQRRKFVKFRNSIVLFQIYSRKFLMTNQVKKKVEAVKKIQTLVRCYLVRSQFLNLKTSAIFVQRKFRANREMRIVRAQFLNIKAAVIIIQKWFRSVRITLQHKHHYIQLRKATIKIQQKYRANVLMKNQRAFYLQLKTAVILVENKYLGNKLTKKILNEYRKIKSAIIYIQRWYKSLKVTQETRKNYLTLKHSAIIIQRSFRAKKLMQYHQQEFLTLKATVVCIQRRFRAKLLMRKAYQQYVALRNATVMIQQRYRARKLMQSEYQYYNKLRKFTSFIQAKYRANKTMTLQRNSYLKLRHSVSFVQKYFKSKQLMKIEREKYLNMRNATILIQRRFRAYKLMKIENAYYISLKKAVGIVQRKYKINKLMKRERDYYQKLKQSAKVIQCYFRAYLLMKRERERFLALKKNVIVIQQMYRCYRLMKEERIHYIKLKTSTMTIQRKFRANLLMKKVKRDYLLLKSVTVNVQRCFRNKIITRNIRNSYLSLKKAVLIVESRYISLKLMQMQRIKYIELKNATIKIQEHFRAYQLMKFNRERYLSLKKSVVTIQTLFRANQVMKVEQNNFIRLRKVSIYVQRKYRAKILMKVERNNYLLLRSTTIYIQRKYIAKNLMKIEKQKFENLKKATVIIQHRFRAKKAMELCRDYFIKTKTATVKLQRWYRSYLLVKKTRKDFITKVNCIYMLQKYVRGYLVRKRFKEFFTEEAIMERKEKRLKEISAVKIQAYWKGYKTRSRENKELSKIREQIKIATEAATLSQTLGHRKKSAINLVLNKKSTIDTIILALQELEYVTRVSSEDCKDLSEILPEYLYTFVISTTCSLPDTNLCAVALSILINFAKYEPAKKNVWLPQFADSLVKVLTQRCEKENLAFSYMCTLLWLLAHDDDCKMDLLKVNQIDKRLMKIYTLCNRKEKMMGLHSSNQSSVFLKKNPLMLPYRKPDWGINYEDKPRTFTNSTFAIKSLLIILGKYNL